MCVCVCCAHRSVREERVCLGHHKVAERCAWQEEVDPHWGGLKCHTSVHVHACTLVQILAWVNSPSEKLIAKLQLRLEIVNGRIVVLPHTHGQKIINHRTTHLSNVSTDMI